MSDTVLDIAALGTFLVFSLVESTVGPRAKRRIERCAAPSIRRRLSWWYVFWTWVAAMVTYGVLVSLEAGTEGLYSTIAVAAPFGFGAWLGAKYWLRLPFG